MLFSQDAGQTTQVDGVLLTKKESKEISQSLEKLCVEHLDKPFFQSSRFRPGISGIFVKNIAQVPTLDLSEAGHYAASTML